MMSPETQDITLHEYLSLLSLIMLEKLFYYRAIACHMGKILCFVQGYYTYKIHIS